MASFLAFEVALKFFSILIPHFCFAYVRISVKVSLFRPISPFIVLTVVTRAHRELTVSLISLQEAMLAC